MPFYYRTVSASLSVSPGNTISGVKNLAGKIIIWIHRTATRNSLVLILCSIVLCRKTSFHRNLLSSYPSIARGGGLLVLQFQHSKLVHIQLTERTKEWCTEKGGGKMNIVNVKARISVCLLSFLNFY